MTSEKKVKIRYHLMNVAISAMMDCVNKEEKQLSKLCDNATYEELCEVGNELCALLKAE